MQLRKFEIFFEDEVPRIPCGKRRVLAEVGRAWVYITLPFQSRRIRIARSKFFALRPVELEA